MDTRALRRSSVAGRLARWLALFALLWPAVVLSEPHSGSRKSEHAAHTGEPTLRLQVKEAANSLHINYSLKNGTQGIVVYDRLVRELRKGTVRDPEQIQRFVNGTTLRLWLGEAPEPDRMASFGFVPHITKLAAHATITRTLRVSAPASEYSAWLPDDPKFVEAPLHQVVMYMEYESSKGLKLQRSIVFPDAFQLALTAQRGDVKVVKSNPVPLETRALRVTDPSFPRFRIEGDP